MNARDEQIRGAIAEQAGAWFAEASLTGHLDEGHRAGLVAWFKASPVHVEEYLQVGLLSCDLAAATDDPELELESVIARALSNGADVVPLGRPEQRPVPDSAWRRTWRARQSIAVAAALLVIAVVSTIWSARDGERFGLARTYSTAHGEQRAQLLPDGSMLHLNTDSQVTVRYSRHERLIEIDRGQALFQVAHENGRRFRVAATDAQVVAVGTQFDVYRRPDTVVVTVLEGEIAIFADRPSTTRSARQLPEHAVRLGAGYQLELRDGQLGVPRPVDPRSVIAWLQRRIVFVDRPLGEVAAEFNRYGSVAIEIDDESLRAQSISGAFDAYDTDSFAAFLESLKGVVVQTTPSRIRVVSALPAERRPAPVAH